MRLSTPKNTIACRSGRLQSFLKHVYLKVNKGTDLVYSPARTRGRPYHGASRVRRSTRIPRSGIIVTCVRKTSFKVCGLRYQGPCVVAIAVLRALLRPWLSRTCTVLPYDPYLQCLHCQLSSLDLHRLRINNKCRIRLAVYAVQRPRISFDPPTLCRPLTCY